MSKPDDIPQDIWDTATEAWNSLYYTLMQDDGPANLIARAIMSAKADERERCAVEAESRFSNDTVKKNKRGQPYPSGNIAIWAAQQIGAALRATKS